jgi:hypothetical protein
MLRKQRLNEQMKIVGGQYAWGKFLRSTRRLDMTSAALRSRIFSGREGMQHGGADSLQLLCHADSMQIVSISCDVLCNSALAD